MNTEFIYEAAATKRMHVVRTIRQQNVAEHSYYVAMLCWKLCDMEPSANLLKAAMFHDLAETKTGDVPATAKWGSDELKYELAKMEAGFDKEHKLEISLSPKEELILKWADSLDLMWFCVNEMMLGNRFVEQMYRNVENYLSKLEPVKNAHQELMKVKCQYAIANTR